MTDPYNLQRFVDAQEGVSWVAVDELRRGSKESHWMWFIFPQLRSLGRSPTAEFYGISSIEEARAYLRYGPLGSRLEECVYAILDWSGRRTATQIFGGIDAMKLRSSLTLFEAASGNPLFAQAIEAFFSGERDERTLALLSGRV